MRTGKEEYGANEDYPEPSMHFTYIFNIFVMFQVFNFINARKLNDELNIFEGLGRSKLFVLIVFLILVIQFIFLTLGHRAINVAKWGLDLKGWLICLGFGATELIVSFILKIIPFEKCFCFCCAPKIREEGQKKKANYRSMNNIVRNPTNNFLRAILCR